MDRKIRYIKDKYTQENVFACAEAATSGFTREASALSGLGSLEELVRARQRQRRDSLFNIARCQEDFEEDPEFSILFKLLPKGCISIAILHLPAVPRPIGKDTLNPVSRAL